MTRLELYRKFRKNMPFMLIGESAKCAIDAAKTVERFYGLGFAGTVKIESVPDYSPDPSFYDSWHHLSERTRDKLKQEYCDNCYGVVVSVACPHCGEWQEVDSIWGCAGYDDPCSPFENYYVVGMMKSAIERVSS